MQNINMNIVYWFYNFFIISEIKVVLISYSLSKATSNAAANDGLIGLISPHSAPCWQYPTAARVGYGQTRWWFSIVHKRWRPAISPITAMWPAGYLANNS